jgi:fibronectin type 3 domain-containing protein
VAGNFNITMTNADISVGKFYDTWNNNANAIITICGVTYGKNSSKTKFNCTSATPPPVSPISDITNLAATALTCNSVKLTWGDVSGEDAYRIRRKTTNGTYVVLADVPANTITYTDNTAAENTSYVYMVRPMQNGAAVKISNEPSVTTPACTCYC